MGKCYDRIDQTIQQWMDLQQMFFVATAPAATGGLVNLSPKGHDTLRVIDPHTLAYLDYGGSGIETVAHLRENGRIVIMMCDFAGPPKIMRFHGRGSVLTADDEGFAQLATHFQGAQLGIRSIINISVTRISDSCGFGVPLYDYQGQREISIKHHRERSSEQIRHYFKLNNAHSIDGLPGLSDSEAEAFQPVQTEPTD